MPQILIIAILGDSDVGDNIVLVILQCEESVTNIRHQHSMLNIEVMQSYIPSILVWMIVLHFFLIFKFLEFFHISKKW